MERLEGLLVGLEGRLMAALERPTTEDFELSEGGGSEAVSTPAQGGGGCWGLVLVLSEGWR